MSQGGRTKIAELLQSTPAGSEVTAKGWVRTKRGNKNVAFIALNDGSIIHNIQIVVDVNKFDDELLKRITTGACIRVTGTLVESQGSGQRVEIQAGDIEVYGSADPDTYPLQKKGHSMEFLREIAYLRRARTPSAPCCVSVTRWLTRSTNISTTEGSTTCTPR